VGQAGFVGQTGFAGSVVLAGKSLSAWRYALHSSDIVTSEFAIQRMVNDAETHAEEDKRFHELVGVRNQADNLIHTVRKSLSEAGDAVDADLKSSIESAISDLEGVMKGEDKAAIETKTQALAEASTKLAENLQAQGGAGSAPGAGSAAADDDVVDAEFEEVNDDKK
jgi:molecular chaperone DnaK